MSVEELSLSLSSSDVAEPVEVEEVEAAVPVLELLLPPPAQASSPTLGGW